MYGHVGDLIQDFRLERYAERCPVTKSSTSRIFVYLVGPNTFIPLNAISSTGKVTTNRVPEDFVRNVIRIFTTSSVEEFNVIFRQFNLQIDMSSHTSNLSSYSPNTTIFMPDLDQIFTVAENKYSSLLAEDKWSGKMAKVNETGFTSTTSTTPNKTTYKCFNCGSTEHKLDSCPFPINKDKIKKNRNAFWEQKRSKSSNNPTKTKSNNSYPSTGKWVPPSKSEKNQRVIDGKQYTWQEGKNSTKKSWVQITDHEEGKKSPPSNSTSNSTPSPFNFPSCPPNADPQTQLAYANFSKSLEDTFRAFQQQFGNS